MNDDIKLLDVGKRQSVRKMTVQVLEEGGAGSGDVIGAGRTGVRVNKAAASLRCVTVMQASSS
jgi:hypothetical protein